MEVSLPDLLDYLAGKKPQGNLIWNGWSIRCVPGGFNSLLYRATGSSGEFAVKFTRRDERNRAEREFNALTALRALGLEIAPDPILLDTDGYPEPVVVQSWLHGEVSDVPPASEAEWTLLLDHLVTIHSVIPGDTEYPLDKADVTCRDAQEGVQRLRGQLGIVPMEGQVALHDLVERASQIPFPTWPAPTLTLCRVDPNILNFIRRPDGWLSVDWENSGWGDPAFEIADLMAHPKYETVPAARWDAVIACYCERRQEKGLATRIRVYYALTLARWAIYFAQVNYKLSRGMTSSRLDERPEAWKARVPARCETYLLRAMDALDQISSHQ